VVQLYLGAPEEAGESPKQLKGFEKIVLKPGESRSVTFELDDSSLAAWDSDIHDWRFYPGTYSIMVGSSSRDIRLKNYFPIKK
jgi:beta-glucosidase